jgi:hypothetical protein
MLDVAAELLPNWSCRNWFKKRLECWEWDSIILKNGVVTPPGCLRYALSLPTSVVITGVDSMRISQQAFEVLRGFRPMSQEEVSALLAKTAPVAAQRKIGAI